MTDRVDARSDTGRVAAGGVAAVTAGAMAANIASYVLAWRASAWLGPLGYGEFASLSAAQLVLAVPALALQTVVARERVHGHTPAALRRLTWRVAGVVVVLALVFAPILAALLHTSVPATLAALAAAPALVLLAGEQGLLQGASRFGALALVLAAAGAAKVVPPVVVSLTVGGNSPAAVAIALVASALGTALLAALTRVTTGVAAAPSTEEVSPGGAGPSAATVLAASQVQLVIVALASVDVVLARAVLSREEAGLYAVGAVVAKAAFWLPQSVGVVLYPRMADPLRSARAVRTAVIVLVAVGAAVVAGTALAAPLARYVVRADYLPVQPLLWLFAVQGSAVSVVSVILLATVAQRRTRAAAVAWVALAVEMIVITLVARSVASTVTIAAVTALVTAALAYAWFVRRQRNLLA